jgi:hypothetical protein
LPPWLSPVERLAVNQSVKGSNPFGGANLSIFSKLEPEVDLGASKFFQKSVFVLSK